MPPETFDPDSLLPLPTAVFHILVALADRDRHGYSIMQDVAARTDGKVRSERRHAVQFDPAHAGAGTGGRTARAPTRIARMSAAGIIA